MSGECVRGECVKGVSVYQCIRHLDPRMKLVAHPSLRRIEEAVVDPVRDVVLVVLEQVLLLVL